MSEATRAKSASERATIAIRYLFSEQSLSNSRAFFDCFEMGDGDDVVKEIIKRAENNPTLKARLLTRGYAFWLTPGYI